MWVEVVLGVVAVLLALLVYETRKATTPHLYPLKREVALLYLKLIVSPLYKRWDWKRQVKPGVKLSPTLSFTLPFKASLENIRDYISVTGIKWDTSEFPPVYGAAVFLYPAACKLAPRNYLFPVFGQIHVRNFFKVTRKVDPKKEYKAVCKVREDPSLVKRGVENVTDMILLDKDSGEMVWTSISHVLIPVKHKYYMGTPQSRPGPPKNAVEQLQEKGVKPELVTEGVWQCDSKLGLRYASVVADYNPIHLYKWTANLFGFPRPIAHGLYICAKGFHEAYDVYKAAGKSYPYESSVTFRKPVFLPSKAAYKVYKAIDPDTKQFKVYYILQNPDKNNELLLEGEIWEST